MADTDSISVEWFGESVTLHCDRPTIRYDSPDPDSYCGEGIELTPERRFRSGPETWHGSFSTDVPNAASAGVFARGSSPQDTVDKLQEALLQLVKHLGAITKTRRKRKTRYDHIRG